MKRLGSTAQDAAKRMDVCPDFGNVLQSGGTGGASARLVVVGNVRSNGEGGGGYAQRFTATYNGEVGVEKPRRYLGDTGGK